MTMGIFPVGLIPICKYFCNERNYEYHINCNKGYPRGLMSFWFFIIYNHRFQELRI